VTTVRLACPWAGLTVRCSGRRAGRWCRRARTGQSGWIIRDIWPRDADDPGDLEDFDEYEDPDNAPPPGLDDAELAALIAAAREAAADQEAAAAERAVHGQTGLVAALSSVVSGRRGPGMPGSGESLAGESGSRAAGFASGKPLDVARGCPVLAQFAEETAGDGDRYPGASDDELLGVICGWDRVEANASARKHAAVAELLRRRPALGSAVDEQSGIPRSGESS
jgi:hypothetical protein